MLTRHYYRRGKLSPEELEQAKSYKFDFDGTHLPGGFKKFLPFEEARSYVRKLGLKKLSEWVEWAKSDKRPNNIPSSPKFSYRDKYISISDWLGVEPVKKRNRKNFLSFKESREVIRKMGFESVGDFRKRKNDIPLCVPLNPNQIYKKEWISWMDFLGTNNIQGRTIRYQKVEYMNP